MTRRWRVRSDDAVHTARMRVHAHFLLEMIYTIHACDGPRARVSSTSCSSLDTRPFTPRPSSTEEIYADLRRSENER